MFVLKKERQIVSLEGYALILPAVSVGNAGQLAVDLVLSSVEPKPVKAGFVDHPTFLPVVGSDPYNEWSTNVMTQSEIFVSEEKKLVIIQLRSPTIKAFSQDFVEKLAKWIKDEKLSQVILLSTFHAYERVDSQLEGVPFRYTATPSTAKTDSDLIKNFGWKELETRHTYSGEEKLIFPGGGLTGSLFRLCTELRIPLQVLLVFCSEGDNVPDALLLAGHLNQWLQIVPAAKNGPSWKFPVSWKLFFGSPPPRTIY